MEEFEGGVFAVTLLGYDDDIDVGFGETELGGEGSKNFNIDAQLGFDFVGEFLDEGVEELLLLMVVLLDELGFVLDVLLEVGFEFIGSHDFGFGLDFIFGLIVFPLLLFELLLLFPRISLQYLISLFHNL